MSHTSSRRRPEGISYQDLLRSDGGVVPDSYLWQGDAGDPGNREVPIARYLGRDHHELEKQHLWSRVWQVACRADRLEHVGDTVVYDIADKSYLLVRHSAGENGISSYPNACLHRGRTLRDGPGRVEELQCAFHGFCWTLSGKLKRIPSAWDFPHLTPAEWALPAVRVGSWGGFIFINPDPDCQPLHDFLGILPTLFERWPLDHRYTRAHVTKVVRANWKLVQEAFMESYHVVSTHPQLLPGFGDANSQYDVFGNAARTISPRGIASPLLAWVPTEQQRLDSALDTREDDPPVVVVPAGGTARDVLAQSARRALLPALGAAVDALSVAELVDSYFVNIFPNSHPWGSYNQIFYRFRPNVDDHASSLMEVLLLAPFAGERPPAAEEVRLGVEDHWRDAVDVLGSLARVFDQDEFNLEAVQKGLRASAKRTVTFADYQESKIRHFHSLYGQWVPGAVTA